MIPFSIIDGYNNDDIELLFVNDLKVTTTWLSIQDMQTY